MAGKSLMDRLARGEKPVTVLTGQVTSGTGGTRTNHAHGLKDGAGNGITPIAAIPVVTATDQDHGTTGLSAYPVAVVSMDSTNVKVRCQGTSITFDLYVF